MIRQGIAGSKDIVATHMNIKVLLPIKLHSQIAEPVHTPTSSNMWECSFPAGSHGDSLISFASLIS